MVFCTNLFLTGGTAARVLYGLEPEAVADNISVFFLALELYTNSAAKRMENPAIKSIVKIVVILLPPNAEIREKLHQLFLRLNRHHTNSFHFYFRFIAVNNR